MSRTPNSSLTNALHILKCFSIDYPELTLSDIARCTNISKSTACRLLQTLESEGFIHQNGLENTYRLGSSLMSLAYISINQFPFLKELTPFLKNLTSFTKETSYISLLENQDVIYLKKEESPFRVQLRSNIGRRNPAYCTGSGLAMLAFLEEEEINSIFPEELYQFTTNTIATREQLHSELEIVRKQGYAIAKGHYSENIISIGAPIFNNKKKVIAAITVTGPINRIMINLHKYIEALIKESYRITNFIKWREEDVLIEIFTK